MPPPVSPRLFSRVSGLSLLRGVETDQISLLPYPLAAVGSPPPSCPPDVAVVAAADDAHANLCYALSPLRSASPPLVLVRIWHRLAPSAGGDGDDDGDDAADAAAEAALAATSTVVLLRVDSDPFLIATTFSDTFAAHTTASRGGRRAAAEDEQVSKLSEALQ